MYKIIVLACVLILFWVFPVWAIDVDQINKDWHEQTEIEPIQTESVEPAHEYNFWKGQFDPWTKEDTYLQMAFVVVTLADTNVTRQNLENGGREISPLVTPFTGEYPSTEKLYDVSFKWMIANTVIAYILPKNTRKLLQITSISLTFCGYLNSYTGKVIILI